MDCKCHRLISLILAVLMTATCVLAPVTSVPMRVNAAEVSQSQSTDTEDVPLPSPTETQGEEDTAASSEEAPDTADTETEEDSDPAGSEDGENTDPDPAEGEDSEDAGRTDNEDVQDPGFTENESADDSQLADNGEDSDPAPIDEDLESVTTEEPEPVGPDFNGYSVIPGMREHMESKPGKDYKAPRNVDLSFIYLDLELFEGIEIDHINAYANSITAADANQYITVSVIDVATLEKTAYRFYAREGALTDFTTGQIVSLYPEDGVTVKVEKGQTLAFGKSDDPLVWNFQNDTPTSASLRGFYKQGSFSSGTAGGCICMDVYAKEAPGTSARDAFLTQALAGKKLSILGDGISSFQDYSNSTAVNSTLGSNTSFYTTGKAPWTVLQTWWQQAADRYGMEILVNNSWSGSTIATYSSKTLPSFGWNTRPDNLHDNTGSVVNPDIVVIYMGANDLSFNISCDPAALTEELYARIEAEDYAPTAVSTLHEATALMVHKVRKNYPDAQIYLFNNPVLKNGNTYRNAYNQVLDALAQRYDCMLVDLHGSVLSNHSIYTTDGVHPNSAGMDVMTDLFADAIYLKVHGCTEHNWVTVPGVAATFREPGLTDGTKCSLCGEIGVAQEEIPILDYEPRMFRWELNADGSALVSTEATLIEENALTKVKGSITDGVFNGVQLSFEEPLELRHDHAWSIEWRSSGTWAQNSMLFSMESNGNTLDTVYLYWPKNFLALGTYNGSHQNYTVSLSGYNTAEVHTFRLSNRIDEDGTNMVYLYVDGAEIGALNRYYVGGTSQNTTATWVSGRNFRFYYMGTSNYPVSGSDLEYLYVNEGIQHDTHTEVILPGYPATETTDGLTEGKYCSACGNTLVEQHVIPTDARVYRWEASGSSLVSQSGGSFTENALTQTHGSISAGGFTGTRFTLAREIALRNDRAWSIEWHSSGSWYDANDGGMLFSAADTSDSADNQYLYHRANSEFIALGTYDGAYKNYAATFTGFDAAVEHTFRLQNRVAENGSNMVYLYVDNQEVGALNQYYEGSTNKNSTNSWLNGKVLRFRYIGTENHPVGNCDLQYIQVNEGFIHDHVEEMIPGVASTEDQTGLTEGTRCSVCGDILTAQQIVPALRETKLQAALMGKKLSILGDSISTYAGHSNATGTNNTLGNNAVWYNTSLLPSVNDTWWKQAADQYMMNVLVNNSWSGSSVTSIRDLGETSWGWNTRPGNLHDNTLTNNTGNLPVNPDIIAIYMGTNDLTDGVACGTANLDEAFFARIQAEDFSPAETTSFEESAALMVYKVRQNYPDAEIFLFNNPVMDTGTAENRASYNAVFEALAEQYHCTVVDLYGSDISNYSLYTQDGIHPNAAGMDVMTQAFADALYERFVLDPEAPSAATKRGVYLSDLPYIASGTSIGYGTYKKDLSPGNALIQLRVDGAVVTFDKGIGAHATSTVTFNISQYRQEYPRFIAKLGVDASQKSAGNVIFKIYGSNVLTKAGDFSGWTLLTSTDALTAASAAVSVDLDVSGYTYLRLYADSNGPNSNDHSVFADARLVKADFSVDSEYFPRLHSLDWYDAQLSQQSYAYNLEHNTRLILERELVSRLGITAIQHSVKNSETMEDTLNWLLDDPHALQLFIETGNIRNAANTLTNLNTLYTTYKGLIGDSGDGYVYKKMLIALAVTWANDVALTPYNFGGAVRYFDIAERFEAARWVYDEGYKHYNKELYSTYNMELMRALMCDYLSKDEAQWVQHYAAKKFPDQPNRWTGPYQFMAYVHPPYYAREEFFSEDTWSTYDEKYDLTQFNILRSDPNSKVYRLWMVYQAGGICWNISRLGQALNKSFGIPSLGTFQPGHEAYLTYSQNANGQGLWSLGNNVGGWQSAYNNWGGTVYRLLMDWGSGTAYSQKTKNSSSYVLLAQGALNRHADFQKSSYLNMLADAYADNAQKLEIYQASLDALELNLDTYLDIIALYKSMGDAVTPEAWRDLALDIADVYTYYPVPMVDLMDAIEPYCGNYGTNIISAKQNALNRARVATAAESLQHTACIALANSMLGKSSDDVLATFSFNGENAGAIVLGTSYDQYAFQLQYSLDGGTTWYTYTKEVEDGLVIQLSPEQIASINAEDDIKMYISGMSVEGEDPNYFTIDILDGAAPVVNRADAKKQISIHDGENWIVGKTEALEYSTDGGSTWTAYDHAVTRFEGNQSIQVRYAAHGTNLLGPAITLSFTDTNERDTFRHIPVSSVNLVRDNDTTYYEGRKGNLAIDANPFTGWHSDNNQADENKQIVVSFDKPRQLSGITYKSAGQNGRFLGVDIYISMDDANWTWVGRGSDWANDDTMKTVVLENSVAAKYVKLQATTNNGYICAQDIDFFEDTTTEVSTVSIVYSTTAHTNGNVTASLMLTEGFTAVGEVSHLFTENGRHTFAYTDADGIRYELEAKVDWIDRDAPTAEVTYDPTAITDGYVTATLHPSEDVTVTNNGGELSHTFTTNGTFTFEIADAAGNTASITATVNWIRPSGKAATFAFDGAQAGKIVLDMFYADKAVNVSYSLDGGSTTQAVYLEASAEKVIALTPEQLAGLSNIAGSDGEIVVTVTVPGMESANGTAVIDLLPGSSAPAVGSSNANTQIAIHDGENWILGKIANLEYSYDGIHWTPYTSGYRFEGAQTVMVRYPAVGLTLPGASRTLTFTDNTDSFSYISIPKVTLVKASNGQYYQNNKGEYALDANPFTNWHSAGGAPREITVRFDQVKQFSGLAYVYTGGSNGRVGSAYVQVSLDGENWIDVGSASGWGNNGNRKILTLSESVSARYVKLVATQTYGNSSGEYNKFIAANILDFYEDTTKAPTDTTQIRYSTTEKTKEDVTASLLLAEGCMAEKITHIFQENGIHVFTYTNAQGEADSMIAKVDWIDRAAPTATVSYSTTDITSDPVTATITPDEPVLVTNTLEGALSYTFTDNGSFTFEMVDEVGNIGSVTATVSWIIPDDSEVVSFSFSGENAGKILLDSFYDHFPVTVSYSLDGGANTQSVTLSEDGPKAIALTPEQLLTLSTSANISGEIRVTVISENLTQQQTIDIVSTTAKPVMMNTGNPDATAQITIHDGENWITGKTAHLEYSTDGATWTAYDHGNTRFPGSQTIRVRYGAQGLSRPSDSIELSFTEESTPTFSYISIPKVTLVKASNGQYYQNNKGEYALDADAFTFWHSKENASREFIVKFDRLRAFAGFTYTLLDSSRNGRFLSVEVYTSLDGENWELADSVTGWSWNAYPAANAPKTLTLEEAVLARYVKLVPTETTGTQTGTFASAREIDFYEDSTWKQVIANVGDQEFHDFQEAYAAAGNDEVTLKSQEDDLLKEAITVLAGLTGNTGTPKLTIPVNDAFVTLDKAAAQAVNRNASGTGSIELRVEDVTDTAAAIEGAAATYEITMIQDGLEVFNAGNAAGQATVSVPLPAGVTTPVVYHVDGAVKTFISSVVMDGRIRFTTGHFSTFTIEEAAVPLFTLAGANMTLGNSLAINFMIKQSDVDSAKVAADGYYAVITRSYSNDTEDVVTTIDSSKWETYSNNKYYKLTYSNIAAKEMIDTLTVRVFHADKTPASELWVDSIRDYAMRMVDKGSAERKTFMVDMLNYGAAAQVEFRYATDNLANSLLSEQQAAYGTQTISMADSAKRHEKYSGMSLTLESNMSMTPVFHDIPQADVASMRAEISFTNHLGEQKNITIPGSSFREINVSTGKYGPRIVDIVVSDARQMVSCTVYKGDTVYAQVQDSIESYAARMIEKYPEKVLYPAVMKFCDAARNYLKSLRN